MKNEYFLMSEKELGAIPVDAWFIGHTHIPYPGDLPAAKDAAGYRIFNAGTPEQLDLNNNTTGVCFVVMLTKSGSETKVLSHAYQSGAVHYYDLAVSVESGDLEKTVSGAVRNLPKESIVRLSITGTVPGEDYAARHEIYEDLLGGFLTYEINDEGLSELITPEKIRAEFAEIGFAATLINALDDPKEKQMAYKLIKGQQV